MTFYTLSQMGQIMKKTTVPLGGLCHNSLSRMDYKEYPECMFAMISAFLPTEDGHDLRRVSGHVVFRSTDKYGRTYRNGLLHSYDDEPAINEDDYKVWYKDGLIHREGDKPAVIECGWYDWVINGKRHREGGKPAVIGSTYKAWYIHGVEVVVEVANMENLQE